MTEFWEKTKSLECFSTEDRGVEYFEDHLYTRCNGGIRSVKKSSNEIVGRADCEEDPISCSKIDLGNLEIYLCLTKRILLSRFFEKYSMTSIHSLGFTKDFQETVF